MSNVVHLPIGNAPVTHESFSQLVLVGPGKYTGLYVSHVGSCPFKGPKLKVMFRLMEHPELQLPRWYRVTGYKGRISAPVHSDLVRELSVVLNQRVRCDRIPIGSLTEIPVSLIVSTVTCNREQSPLHELNQYSVISRLEGRA